MTGTVKKARLYATALGMYEAQVNGEPVDDTYFHPGWTNYRKRLQYQTYAVTLHSGKNRVALTLANGWYKGTLGFMPEPNHYGDTTAALAALCITYADGREEWIGTDESWLCTTGAVQFSEIYDGETQDFTADPAAPQPARLFNYGFDTIVGQENEPVRCLQRLPVVKEFTAPNGEHAALMTEVGLLQDEPSMLLMDLGGWTVDLMRIRNIWAGFLQAYGCGPGTLLPQ